jgi:hypothetical protein
LLLLLLSGRPQSAPSHRSTGICAAATSTTAVTVYDPTPAFCRFFSVLFIFFKSTWDYFCRPSLYFRRVTRLFSLSCIRSPDPLDSAIDFLSLARDFVRKGNFPLTAVSLRKSEAALSVPITGITVAYARRVRTVKEQIARTIDELRRSAH